MGLSTLTWGVNQVSAYGALGVGLLGRATWRIDLKSRS